MTSTPDSSPVDLGIFGPGWYEVDGDDFDELYFEGSSDTAVIDTYDHPEDTSTRTRYFVRAVDLDDADV